MDRVTLFCIKNCTNDTLYIEFTESDTLDNWIFWKGNIEYPNIPVAQEDTTWIYIHGEKMIADNMFFALPDSIVFMDPRLFSISKTCYIYAIKQRILTQYTLDDIREKKLYDRRVVTKKDFHKRQYEYKYMDDGK